MVNRQWPFVPCLCLLSPRARRRKEKRTVEQTSIILYWFLMDVAVPSVPSIFLLSPRRSARATGGRETERRGKWRQAVSVLSPFYLSTARGGREGTYRHWDETAGIEKEGRKIRLVPGGYIPTQETKQKECWK